MFSSQLVRTSLSLAAKPYTLRAFSSAPIAWKKASGGSGKKGGKSGNKGKASEEDEEALEAFDSKSFLNGYKTHFQEVTDHFKQASAKLRTNQFDPTTFDSIKITTPDGEVHQFTELAQTVLKGKNLYVTLFDAKDQKHVMHSILEAQKKLIPEQDPTNPQQLIIRLPAVTSEVKEQLVKEIKKNFETYKTSSQKLSLSSVRAKALKELKDVKKNDEVKKVTAELEKLHKEAGKTLEAVFKDAEKAVKGGR